VGDRDMLRELRDWRMTKVVDRGANGDGACLTPTRVKSARTDENTPTRMRCKASDNKTHSPPKTPGTGRTHNAMSPLMEVCQNTGRSIGEMKRCFSAPLLCRLGASPLASPSSFCVSPTLVATSSIAAPATTRQDCVSKSPSMEKAESGMDYFALEMLAWEESVQEPTAPPPSPAALFVGLLRRSDATHFCDLHGFLHALPLSLRVALGDAGGEWNHTVPEELVQAAPLRRSLLECLDQTDAGTGEATAQLPSTSAEQLLSPASSTTTPLPLQCSPNAGEAAAPALAVESPVSSSASISMLSLSDEGDAAEAVDAGSPRRQAIQNHHPVWPAQTALEMEDHLSRAANIEVFWFFEVRDRCNYRTAHERGDQTPLDCVPEYPCSWAQWQIDAAHARSAATRARKSRSEVKPAVHGRAFGSAARSPRPRPDAKANRWAC